MLYTHAAAALIAAAVAAAGAWQTQNWRYGAIERDRLATEAELRRNNQQAADRASAGFEAAQVQIRTEFVPIEREVERVVEKPVYLAQCFDADGLRVLNAAITGTTPGQPAPTVP